MKKDPNSLEEFFNSRLQEAEFPFDERDWEDMEKRLDAFDSLQDKPAGMVIKGKHLWLGLPAVLLIFLAGWFGHAYLATPSVRLASEAEVSTSETAGSRLNTEVAEPPSASNTSDYTDEIPQDIALDTTTSGNSPKATGPVKAEAGSPADIPTVELPATQKQAVNTRIQGSPAGSPRDRATREDPLAESDAKVTVTRHSDLAWAEGLGISLEMEEIMPEIRWTASTIPADSDTEETVKTRAAGQWSIALTVAPDLNGVGAMGNFKMAWEAGLMASYNFTPSWRISTGLLYANKAYLASGEDYHPPEGYWDYVTNGNIPEEVDAACDILDMPLNVTYIWNPQSGFRLTTTLGTSSYFILSEKYTYTFGYYNPGQSYGWQTSDNSTAMFAMINLGVGGEWQLSPNLSLGLDPYVKIPVREIGYGNVRLSGMGMFFSIRKVF